ncbi:PAS domain S-box protein [Rhizobium sp. ARZ01]|nr:PAS domain S-box protein [Rhizobium sp. ARZ01]
MDRCSRCRPDRRRHRPHGTILYANHKFCDISGYTQQELIGANHRLLNSGTHDRQFFGEMFRTIRSGQT